MRDGAYSKAHTGETLRQIAAACCARRVTLAPWLTHPGPSASCAQVQAGAAESRPQQLLCSCRLETGNLMRQTREITPWHFAPPPKWSAHNRQPGSGALNPRSWTATEDCAHTACAPIQQHLQGNHTRLYAHPQAYPPNVAQRAHCSPRKVAKTGTAACATDPRQARMHCGEAAEWRGTQGEHRQ